MVEIDADRLKEIIQAIWGIIFTISIAIWLLLIFGTNISTSDAILMTSIDAVCLIIVTILVIIFRVLGLHEKEELWEELEEKVKRNE